MGIKNLHLKLDSDVELNLVRLEKSKDSSVEKDSIKAAKSKDSPVKNPFFEEKKNLAERGYISVKPKENTVNKSESLDRPTELMKMKSPEVEKVSSDVSPVSECTSDPETEVISSDGSDFDIEEEVVELFNILGSIITPDIVNDALNFKTEDKGVEILLKSLDILTSIVTPSNVVWLACMLKVKSEENINPREYQDYLLTSKDYLDPSVLFVRLIFLAHEVKDASPEKVGLIISEFKLLCSHNPNITHIIQPWIIECASIISMKILAENQLTPTPSTKIECILCEKVCGTIEKPSSEASLPSYKIDVGAEKETVANNCLGYKCAECVAGYNAAYIKGQKINEDLLIS